MDMMHEPLDILFRKIHPEEIYDAWLEYETETDRLIKNNNLCYARYVLDENPEGERFGVKSMFFRGADVFHTRYSQDEIDLIRKKITQDIKKQGNGDISVFFLLSEFAKDILTFKFGDPMCDKNAVFRWREMTFRLGQDLFTTAFRAYDDIKKGGTTTYFGWPTVIHINNPIVREVVERGISENHSHLYGAVPPAMLSWICLMNHPEDIQTFAQDTFAHDLTTTTQYSAKESRMTWEERIYLAAWIRYWLFRKISCEEIEVSESEDFDTETDVSDSFQISSFDWLMKNSKRFLHQKIGEMRREYGNQVPLSDGSMACLDYSFPSELGDEKNNGYYRLMAGERYFLYKCFYECYSGHFNSFEQDMLYLYLLLKTHFRGEMVQVNQRVGFRNFLNYQDRKSKIWENRKEYMAESYRIAINGKMENQVVDSQEDRLMFFFGEEDAVSWITGIDREILFAEDTIENEKNLDARRLAGEWSNENIQERARKLKNFYTLHFAKYPCTAKKSGEIYPPRNIDIRENAKVQAMTLASALSKYPYLRYRIRGIDTCSREIGCRPETFATEYRFLRNFRASSIYKDKIIGNIEPWPRLFATAHAGEDFLDLADGLRAIDETIQFLEFERGDRIGHALALGVNPAHHYKFKRNHVITTKLNRLDDLVWLLFRSQEYNVHIPSSLYRDMEEKANNLFFEIYQNAMKKSKWFYSLTDYYHSWKQRSDHPDCHDTLKSVDSKGEKEIHAYGGSTNTEKAQYVLFMKGKHANQMSNQERVDELLYYYHHDPIVREVGNEAYDFEVKQDYIRLIRDMQDVIIKDLSVKGIYIECNPSSNYLIGTIEQYKEHPIFRFCQYGMGIKSSNHLCVSINTDDMGVFDTSLENEYALIAAALEDMKNEDGEPLYDDDFIGDYLEHLRVMGHRQTFPGI